MKKTTSFVFSVVLLPVLIFFQGCGNYEIVRQNSGNSTESLDFFGYAYKSAPEFYHEIHLLKPQGESESLSRFQFVGAAAFPADPLATIEFDVEVKTPQGTVVCPSHSGILPMGRSSVSFECVSMVRASEVVVRMTVEAAGKESVFEKTYRW